MITEHLVDISRLQFAVTALFHFLFVPLTLGMTWMLVIMETVYVITGKQIWKDMTQFWGKLFGINFVLGVTTGITMEFQFGTNWSYYSHYVGDVFGAPLAIEGLMAFFLESTMVGLFFFGWQRMSRVQHWFATLLMALGTSLSALWILVANGWMQNPVGAAFNYETMRMEMLSFSQILLNPEAQNKFVHTVSAGYVMGAMFVLSISAWYLLNKRDVEFAKRSFHVAAAFGFAAICSVIVLGDESGYSIGKAQQTKMAAIEAMWHTEPPPASFNLIAGIDEQNQRNNWAVEIPYVMGIIGTRSLDTPIPGIAEIKAENRERIELGKQAVAALDVMRADKAAGRESAPDVLAQFEAHKEHLGFGLLLKKYTDDVANATPQMITNAMHDSVPKVAPMFWSFRVMVGAGFLMLLLFSLCLLFTLRGTFMQKRWLLKFAFVMLPAPWIAIEAGWIVAEYGRQPWTIYGVLPTHLSVSNIDPKDVMLSLAGFVAFYSVLFVIEVYLMQKYVRLGPASLGTGRYFGEKPNQLIDPSQFKQANTAQNTNSRTNKQGE
ncbi:cytochrome d terminal oxidase subunit 1 [Moraxella caviae]|uniref:Cytochrome d terminal oxidase subunit 1 n=1 Tax=Moraxella caviae TaxID=34060 RepID=A0A1S9ZW70_9GAMM|nr:cytochrome ubiquinol oxidase subunit I [Moraxella caviae]OOR87734.1 cytochrome d terminal oxidase subunit 1 [Moraxella caviae]STZ10147.1 Cytochrome d ubiquinol oxidase subunit 1 [Moraxella caviae]